VELQPWEPSGRCRHLRIRTWQKDYPTHPAKWLSPTLTIATLAVLPLFFLSTPWITLVHMRLANDAKPAKGGGAPFNVYCKALKSDVRLHSLSRWYHSLPCSLYFGVYDSLSKRILVFSWSPCIYSLVLQSSSSSLVLSRFLPSFPPSVSGDVSISVPDWLLTHWTLSVVVW
jgi:hypothetical protein